MDSGSSFDRLIQEALDHSMKGWDFTWLDGRWQSSDLPWDYRKIVTEHTRRVSSLLDMGTGGGEFLASLAPLPPITCATEAYPPNVPVARDCLGPFGVRVDQIDEQDEPDLPYSNNTFDLIINRHESYKPSEVYRILKPEGHFITQQVGGENCIDLNRFMGAPLEPDYQNWHMLAAVGGLAKAGFDVKVAEEAFPALEFYDVGAVVYYLKIVSWQISDFDVNTYHEPLMAIHHKIEQDGKWTVTEHRFLIDAVK
jgi:SAM-dependent methyltransferase